MGLSRFHARASGVGTASRRCTALALCSAALACAPVPTEVPPPAGHDARVHRSPSDASPEGERPCAWYGEAGGDVLYFGRSAFWRATREAGGDPRADLAVAGPRRIGRFDLRARAWLDPIDAGPRASGEPARTGVWDVLPLGGRLYFTSLFDGAGFVDLASGRVTALSDSAWWNELAAGPVLESGPTILASRYADAGEGGGAVLVLDRDGAVLRRIPLPAAPGFALAAKTPAWDPVTGELWVTTDRLPLPEGPGAGASPARRPALVLDGDGEVLARFDDDPGPEMQFVRFSEAGRGWIVLAREGRLEVAVLAPGAGHRGLAAAPRVVLDPSFAADFDFAQDVQPAADGGAVITQWSGRVHRVDGDGTLGRSWTLPRTEESLYYSAVPTPDGGVCATRCDAVEVVCAPPLDRGPSR